MFSQICMHSSRVKAGVGVEISKAPTEGTLIFSTLTYNWKAITSLKIL